MPTTIQNQQSLTVAKRLFLESTMLIMICISIITKSRSVGFSYNMWNRRWTVGVKAATTPFPPRVRWWTKTGHATGYG